MAVTSMQILPAEIIKKKRNKEELSSEEIQSFIQNYTEGKIPDYQMSAFLMATYFQGMSNSETLALTKSMLNSGRVIKFASGSTKVDKHSTGGVGDKTSLILGPIVAAAGVPVPMISGRGLGHTGGTLDKLESIPGFDVNLSIEEFMSQVDKHNICFIGQTAEICPADKKIYALRDVTATVESLPLICASIMSKKMAEGIDGLVLDVKYGSGAFMKTADQAEDLAKALMAIAKGYNKTVTALVTDMNQPMGRYAGNALEVFECVEIMRGKKFLNAGGRDLYEDTRELSLQLSAHMIVLGKMAETFEDAYELAKEILNSGLALKKFEELCALQKGRLQELPTSEKQIEIRSTGSGYIASFDTEKIGVAGILVQAGRAKTSDKINFISGVEFHAKVGDSVEVNDVVMTLHGSKDQDLSAAAAVLGAAFKVTATKPAENNLIYKTLL